MFGMSTIALRRLGIIDKFQRNGNLSRDDAIAPRYAKKHNKAAIPGRAP
jgi:hypothetical protein